MAKEKRRKDILLSDVPTQHLEKVFENLIKFRGVEGSIHAVANNIELAAAFPWMLTDEGHKFWQQINDGVEEPEDTETSAIHSELQRLLISIGVSLN